VTLDYARKRMILEPQTQKVPPIDYDMSGLWLKTQGQPFDQVWVEQVFENSPAAEADIRVGDRILALDNQPVSELSIDQVRQRLREPGQTVQLQIQRQQQTLPVQLMLKPLI
jgi:C-terminal processing protease CtpA/Prc